MPQHLVSTLQAAGSDQSGLTGLAGLITDIVVSSDEVALLTQLGASVHRTADGAASRGGDSTPERNQAR